MKQRLQVETSSARPPAGCGRWVLLSHADSRAQPNPPEIRPNFCTLRAGRVSKPEERRVSDPCASQAKAESCNFFFLSVFQGILVLLLHFKAGCSLLLGFFPVLWSRKLCFVAPPMPREGGLGAFPKHRACFCCGHPLGAQRGVQLGPCRGAAAALGNARGREKGNRRGDANPSSRVKPCNDD